MTLIRRGTNSTATQLFSGLQFRVTFSNQLVAPTNLQQVLAAEEASLSATSAVTIGNGITTLNTTHDTTALAGPFDARFSCVVVTDGVSDLDLLSVESMNEIINNGDTLDTTHTYTVTPTNV